MSENANIIKRKASFKINTEEVGKKLNVKIDYDPHDDVYHDPIGTSELKGSMLPEGIPDDLCKYLPTTVGRAMEDANRNAICSQMHKSSMAVIIAALEKINVPGEYVGLNEAEEEVSVSCQSYVDEVVDNEDGTLTLNLVNPEHLLNDIINGVGQVYCHEILVDQAQDNLVQQNINALLDYFDVYGERVGEPSDHGWMGEFSEEYFKDLLDSDLIELTEEDIAHELMKNTESSEDFEKGLTVVKEALVSAGSDIAGVNFEKAIRDHCTSMIDKEAKRKKDKIAS